LEYIRRRFESCRPDLPGRSSGVEQCSGHPFVHPVLVYPAQAAERPAAAWDSRSSAKGATWATQRAIRIRTVARRRLPVTRPEKAVGSYGLLTGHCRSPRNQRPGAEYIEAVDRKILWVRIPPGPRGPVAKLENATATLARTSSVLESNPTAGAEYIG